MGRHKGRRLGTFRACADESYSGQYNVARPHSTVVMLVRLHALGASLPRHHPTPGRRGSANAVLVSQSWLAMSAASLSGR